MAVTVKEIALAAGVSKAAVSKVLHDSSASVRVGAESAARIREIADQLGYVPNANARILRHARTNTIGIYFDDLAGIASGPLYTTHLLSGICQVVFRRHYRVALVAELDHNDAIRSLSDGRLDGVIWCRVVRDQKTMTTIAQSRIPVVSLSPIDVPTVGRFGSVLCDNQGGIASAVDHLVGLGHREIAFLCEAREEDASDCVDRRQAFFESMARHGLSLGEDRILAWSWDLDEFPSWREKNKSVTAILCWSERCAGQLLLRAANIGVNVPADLSVVGFDSTQYCDTTTPKLTAVRQPIQNMGMAAAELILDLIDGKVARPSPVLLPCPLDIRQSTAKPPTFISEQNL